VRVINTLCRLRDAAAGLEKKVREAASEGGAGQSDSSVLAHASCFA
jgi:hypothetical protein